MQNWAALRALRQMQGGSGDGHEPSQSIPEQALIGVRLVIGGRIHRELSAFTKEAL